MTTKKSSQKERPEATASKSKPEKKIASEEKPVVMKESKPAPKPSTPPAPKGPAVPFARWFQAKGFKPHWIGGMKAFADTSGRKTMEEWDQVFKNY
jgi:hypothetical protein